MDSVEFRFSSPARPWRDGVQATPAAALKVDDPTFSTAAPAMLNPVAWKASNFRFRLAWGDDTCACELPTPLGSPVLSHLNLLERFVLLSCIERQALGAVPYTVVFAVFFSTRHRSIQYMYLCGQNP